MDATDSPEVMTVLPKELRLGAPPTMPQARTYLFRQQSTLSAYNPDDQIQINIPRLQRSYLSKDSYLQFRLNGQYEPKLKNLTTIPAAGTTAPSTEFQFAPDLLLDDSGAWGLFEKIEVFDYLGSTVLETIDGLPQLVSLLLDMGTDFTDPDHKGQVAHGIMQPYVANAVRDSSVVYSIETAADITIDSSFFTATTNLLYITIDGVAVTFTVPSNTVAPGDNATGIIAASLNAATDPNGKTLAEYGLNCVGTTRNRIRLQSYNRVFQVGSGTNNANAKLGLPTTAATASQSTITSSLNIGLPFYQGGLPLVTAGITTTSTKRDFSFQFSIPLLSFLGVLSKKMVPLHNGFTIVLTVASKFKPMFTAFKQAPQIIYQEADPVGATFTGAKDNLLSSSLVLGNNTIEPLVGPSYNINGPNRNTGISMWSDPTTFWWQITDVAMVCHVLELGPVAESMILSSSQGQPLIVHTKQMRYYRGASSSSQAEFYLPLNLNVASLTNVLWFMRPDAVDNDIRFQSCGARSRNYLQRWEFQYGSTVLPQSQGIQSMYMTGAQASSGNSFSTTDTGILNGFTECYSELMKARPVNTSRGRMSVFQYGVQNYPGLGRLYAFAHTPYKTVNFNIAESAIIPKFACGLNMELAPGKQDLVCGLNTNGMNTQIRGYFHPNYLTDTDKLNVVVDAYAEYDAFINISPGIATTVSF